MPPLAKPGSPEKAPANARLVDHDAVGCPHDVGTAAEQFAHAATHAAAENLKAGHGIAQDALEHVFARDDAAKRSEYPGPRRAATHAAAQHRHEARQQHAHAVTEVAKPLGLSIFC